MLTMNVQSVPSITPVPLDFQPLIQAYINYLKPKSSWPRYQQICDLYFSGWTYHPQFMQIEDWHKSLITIPHQANKGLAFLKAMYTWAIRRRQFVGLNPATGIRQHRTFPRERVMESREVTLLLSSLETLPIKIRALLLLLLTTGCRLSEALAMREEHVNMQTGEWIQLKTKNGKPHMTYIPTQARDALRLLIKNNGYFFGGVYEHHWSRCGAEKTWRQVRMSLIEEDGNGGWTSPLADVRLHDFRRTFSTFLHEATNNDYLVKRCINHANRNITSIYVKISYEKVAKALQAQADRFGALAKAEARPVPIVAPRSHSISLQSQCL